MRRAMERLREINRESDQTQSILKAMDNLLEAALASRNQKSIEKARTNLLSAFEARVDFKIRVMQEGEELARQLNEEE